MGDKTNIGWTDATANAVVGCSRENLDCLHCYAEGLSATRLKHTPKYKSLAIIRPSGEPQWTGEIRLDHKALAQMIRWRRPRKVFLTAMGDPFHPALPLEDVALWYGLCAAAPQHHFQVLTKRPQRALEFFQKFSLADARDIARRWLSFSGPEHGERVDLGSHPRHIPSLRDGWDNPLPNVWLGISAGHQKALDTMGPLLMRCPAAVRFLSCEPMTEQMVIGERLLLGEFQQCAEETQDEETDGCRGCPGFGYECAAKRGPKLDWVIVGGESGRKARPFDLAWGTAMVRECQHHLTPVFFKQLGHKPMLDGKPFIAEGKGSAPEQWPPELDVQEFPPQAKIVHKRLS